jgi:hypothetical protein
MGTARGRRYIIDKKLQYRPLGYNAAYFFIAVTVLALALFIPLIFEISDPSLSPRQQTEVAGKLLRLHSNLLILVILGFHDEMIFMLQSRIGRIRAEEAAIGEESEGRN